MRWHNSWVVPIGQSLRGRSHHRVRDRVAGLSRFAQPAVVLAHVLVHEITHILQGVNRHSDRRLKAHWTPEDYRAMASKPLPFTPVDVQLIRLGLAPLVDP